MNTSIKGIIVITLALVSVASATSPRQVISLDGRWQIAEGKMDVGPATFGHEVPVPGLVDMATPPFVEPGPKVANRWHNEPAQQKDPRRGAFWYRRTFKIGGAISPVAMLKIGKAMFGTKVILNGTLLGDHAPCFTPGFFDVKPALKTGENELLIRVGADRNAVGLAIPSGFDVEKTRYIPGIFDSVELILSGTPHIENVQVAPDITNQQAKVRLYLDGSQATAVTVEIREVKSGQVAGHMKAQVKAGAKQLDLILPVANCRLWSPEDPFLYRLTVRTSGDEFTTRFGMREFHFDLVTRRAMLNGKPYFMRGSNITLYRFFEDSGRGDLPWNEKWVRLLHQRVKDMHWNCLRYSIGFPPEAWYDIADEAGILIEDEFPLWFFHSPKELKAAELVAEYTEWMRERWNHPCVVIWDANNETRSTQTSPAIRQVRALDLSGRPWDNSYSPPQEPGDMVEAHPYHFADNKYKLASLANANPNPLSVKDANGGVPAADKHAVVINEYGYLWLNRDGTPTTLTEKFYLNLLGTNSTTVQRRQLYARYTAAETEFWRSHRQAAAVMHFTALGYSRPDGQTSDHWIDIKKLTWEPEFYRYVRDSFAPLGVMIDTWAEDYPPGKQQDFPVVIINDLESPWKGDVQLRILRDNKAVAAQTLPAEVAGFGTTHLTFTTTIPEQSGSYQVEATLPGPVRSLRDFTVLTQEQMGAPHKPR